MPDFELKYNLGGVLPFLREWRPVLLSHRFILRLMSFVFIHSDYFFVERKKRSCNCHHLGHDENEHERVLGKKTKSITEC